MKFKSLFALALTVATLGLSLPAVAGERKHHNRNHGGNSEHNSGRHNYYGKYQYHKMGNSYIHVGSKGDYFDSKGSYHEASEHPDYAQYYSDSYDYKKYSYYEGGKYYDHN
jgi:hypothetical protein